MKGRSSASCILCFGDIHHHSSSSSEESLNSSVPFSFSTPPSSTKTKELPKSMLLEKELVKYFIIREILGLSKQWCEKILSSGVEGEEDGKEGGLNSSFKVCAKCLNGQVREAWAVYQEFRESQGKLEKTKASIKTRMEEGIRQNQASLVCAKVVGNVWVDDELRRAIFPKVFQEFADKQANTTNHNPSSLFTSSEEKRQAAAAALARFEKSKKMYLNDTEQASRFSRMHVRDQAQQELQAEKKNSGDKPCGGGGVGPSSQDPAKLAIQGIFYTCPMVGKEVGKKELIQKRLQEYLQKLAETDKESAACLLIHSCNEPDKIKICVETITKLLNNIIEHHPDNERFRKIRLLSNTFQEKVDRVEGSVLFLDAAGFRLRQEKNEDTEAYEAYWVFDPSNLVDQLSPIYYLCQLRDKLTKTTRIELELDRNLQVLLKADVERRNEFPPEFYDSKEDSSYPFCLIRVRFPDGLTLQGTFKSDEKLSKIYDFVRPNLLLDDLHFTLETPDGDTMMDGSETLTGKKLTPLTLVDFKVAKQHQEIFASGAIPYLKSEVMELLNCTSC